MGFFNFGSVTLTSKYISSLFLVLYLCISELVIKKAFHSFGNMTQVIFEHLQQSYSVDY